MNVFIAANDNYIYPAKVMLTSLLLNNANADLKIYFMHSSVKHENIRALEELVGQHKADFVPVQINPDDFTEFLRTERFPVEVYYRFLVPHILPKSESRAIWLDVDLVVNGPLDSFYYQDFDGCFLSGCRDIGDHREKMRLLGCPSDCTYINSGVILFNAEQMRQYNLEDFLNYYLAHKKDIVWFDQDVINGIFAGRIKVWDCDKYNVQVLWNRKKQSHFEQCVIAHYIGPYEPWQSEYTNPSAELWDRYHASTFKVNCLYILKRKLNRLIQRYVWTPFRIFRSNIYANSSILKKLRDAIRQS